MSITNKRGPRIVESRNEKIAFSGSLQVEPELKKEFRTEPNEKAAYDQFKADERYSKATDAIDRLVRDGLIMNGYLPQVTAPFVAERRHAALQRFIEQESLKQGRAINWHEAIELLIDFALNLAEYHDGRLPGDSRKAAALKVS